MTKDILILSLTASGLASALVAGVFLTFSDFVMQSLSSAHPRAGTGAMQIINRKVYKTIFMVLLMGMVPVSLAWLAYGSIFAHGSGTWPVILAALVYLIGVFAVTAFGNVPMNQRLDAMPLAQAADTYWPDYVQGWIRWNHVRWVSATLAAIGFVYAALELARP